MKKIHNKIIGLVILCLLLLGLTMSFVSILKIRSLGNEDLQTLEQELRDHFDLMARSQVEIALSLAEMNYSRRNELGEEAARKEAEFNIRELRYAEDGYFFIYDSKGNTVVLLGNEAEGTNRLDLKDADGKYLIREIIASAKTGDGYTDFQYNRPGETEASPKRSYTAYFAPWDWIIGTGNYVDDIDALIDRQRLHMEKTVRNTVIIIILTDIAVILLAVLFSWILGRKISSPVEYLAGDSTPRPAPPAPAPAQVSHEPAAADPDPKPTFREIYEADDDDSGDFMEF